MGVPPPPCRLGGVTDWDISISPTRMSWIRGSILVRGAAGCAATEFKSAVRITSISDLGPDPAPYNPISDPRITESAVPNKALPMRTWNRGCSRFCRPAELN